MKFILATIACSFLYSIAPAQTTEQWDTYMALYDKKPGSVMVDMGLMPVAPDKKYPNLVITGPQAQHCNTQGMPDKDEITALEDVLEVTNNFLAGVTPKVLAGTFTYNCQRLNYYYVKDTTGIRNALARLYSRAYPGYRYVVNIKHDPHWKTYRTFLYPDDTTMTWMENNKVITKLIQAGDTLSIAREIRFELFFKSEVARQEFANYAAGKGLKVGRQTESRTPPVAYGIVLTRMAAVKTDEINAITADLKAEARKHDGTFVGWNAAR